MKEFTYTITDPEGIHARPAGELVKAAKAFESALPFRHNAVRQAFMKSWAIPKQKSITWTSFVPM